MNGKKEQIKQAVHRFADGNLAENAKRLLKVLGYESERTIRLRRNTVEGFLEFYNLDPESGKHQVCALYEECKSIDFIFQLTKDEVPYIGESSENRSNSSYDVRIFKSYLFFALKLRGDQYSRTKLSQITREINKPGQQACHDSLRVWRSTSHWQSLIDDSINRFLTKMSS